MRSAFALLLLWASPAAAADISGELGLVSDYRYRGLSLSGGRAAVQGELLVEHLSGTYLELWGSVSGTGDPASPELNFTAGYARDLATRFSVELSGTYYAYPSASSGNCYEATASLGASLGDASANLGVSYMPRQRATRSESGRSADNIYLFGSAEWEVPGSPLSLAASLGHERGALDEVGRGGKWDWSLGGVIAAKSARLGLAYVGSTADGGDRRALVASLFLASR
jgi:uncharacterized protein (TIGR02001 family)